MKKLLVVSFVLLLGLNACSRKDGLVTLGEVGINFDCLPDRDFKIDRVGDYRSWDGIGYKSSESIEVGTFIRISKGSNPPTDIIMPEGTYEVSYRIFPDSDYWCDREQFAILRDEVRWHTVTAGTCS